MTTGGLTGPAENREALNQQNQGGTTKVDQVRKVGKYCRDLTQKPEIQEKIKQFHQGKITKSQLEELFRRDLSGKSTEFKGQIGVGEGDDAFDAFLRKTKCFENQFMHEITHNTQMKESAKEETLDGCIETLRDEYHITTSQEATVRAYLATKETPQGLNIFLESGKKRKKTLQRALPSPLTEKTLDDIDFNDLHSKIANLPPSDPNSYRIQSIWSTMLGGIRIQEGEDVKAAFKRIQEEGSEGDLTADYEAFFSCPDSLISKTNKDRIRDFLVRQYVPTISLENLQEIDQAAANKLLAQYKVNEHTETSPDTDWESAIKSQREESARYARGEGLATYGISTKHLDVKTQLRILGGLSSARRLNQKNSFARGHIGGSSIPGIDYEEAFESMNSFKPDEVMTDEGLVAKLEEAHGNTIKNLDNFGPGAVMRWKNKGPGDKEMIGYYVIERTLGNTLSGDGEPGDIKLRFLGNNQNGGRLSRAGIPQTKTGPQFFEYLDRCADGGEIDFISDGGTLDSEELKTILAADGASFYTDVEAKQELKSRYGSIEIQDEDTLNEEVDKILYGKQGNSKESADSAERKLCTGMTFALCKESELDTFEIEEVVPPEDGKPGHVKVWDGWGSGEDARRELTFGGFVRQMKHFKGSYKDVYRIPFGKSGERMGQEQFNLLLKSEEHALDGKFKNIKKVAIKDGVFGTYDANGIFDQKTIVKVGDDKDLHISAIEGNMVTVSKGTFKQTEWDENLGKFKQKPEFHGSHPYQIPLQLLWSYLQTNKCELVKEDTTPRYKKSKKSDGKMGWLNILAHSHSLGVLLHGDLWKAPFKAWEEGHHKEHAFHGKLTAALAIEKLQSSKGPISSMMNWAEWPSLMVADSNGSFQSYIKELVDKIDSMGSYHRTRLIKKWSQEHFPSPKFMAAMFASMMNFGQLYPYNRDENDPRNKDHNGKPCHEWFWYNSIRHSVGIDMPNYPLHMPVHPPAKPPQHTNGDPLTEIQACRELFNKFNHPILQNLGRQFQKYMNNAHDGLIDGGKGNLTERDTMERKLEWMMQAVISGKPTEAFGGATDLWLGEGYPTHISTMPYAALLFGNREQQLLPRTQEHLRTEFQKTTKIPMFIFAQNRALGDTFRETGVAFAYTLDPKEGDTESPGSQLEKLIKSASPRITGKNIEIWSKKFQAFWTKYGTDLMHKMTGMRDPMLNLMINDRPLFDELIKNVPEHKKAQYNELKKRSNKIDAYYGRLHKMQASPAYSGIRGSGEFYKGDHFRFRKGFDVGYPMFWVDWDGYIDENLDAAFVSGDGTKGDGVFNEMRGFFDAMPQMAKDMAKQMGMEDNKKYIDRICQSLYEKNVKTIKPILQKRKFNNDVKAVYFNVSSMILGFADVRQLTQTAANPGANERFLDYKNKMDEINIRAEKIANTKGFAESMKFRTKMWERFEKIVEAEIPTQKLTLDQVFRGEFDGVSSDDSPDSHSPAIQHVTSQTLSETEAILRNTHHKQRKKGPMVRDDESLSQGGQGSQQGQDDDTVPPSSPINRP